MFKISNSIYVDSVNGRDWKNGQSESTAVQTLQKAVQILENGTQILLKNGTYKNKNFGSGELNNPTVMNIIDNLTIFKFGDFVGGSFDVCSDIKAIRQEKLVSDVVTASLES